MLTLVDAYDVLSLSNIEGIEAIAQKFSTIYKTIKKKPYDVLDHRKVEFNYDYEDFRRQLTELEVCKMSSIVCLKLDITGKRSRSANIEASSVDNLKLLQNLMWHRI